MAVAGGEDQCLAKTVRRDLGGDRLTDDPVEALRVDALVEGREVVIEIHVERFKQIDLAGARTVATWT